LPPQSQPGSGSRPIITSANRHRTSSITAHKSKTARPAGLQFSSLAANSDGARFLPVDDKADYCVLDDLASKRIDIKLIAGRWEDLLRGGLAENGRR